MALSGEAADEVFGGYKHMHVPQIQQARAFPWIALNIGAFDKDGTGVRPELWSALALEEYRRDAYAGALGRSSGSTAATTTARRTTSSTGCG